MKKFNNFLKPLLLTIILFNSINHNIFGGRIIPGGRTPRIKVDNAVRMYGRPAITSSDVTTFNATINYLEEMISKSPGNRPFQEYIRKLMNNLRGEAITAGLIPPEPVSIDILRERYTELTGRLNHAQQNTVEGLTTDIRELRALIEDIIRDIEAKTANTDPTIMVTVQEQNARLTTLEQRFLPALQQQLQKELQQDQHLANLFEPFVEQAMRGRLNVENMMAQNFSPTVRDFLLSLQVLNAQIDCPICFEGKGRNQFMTLACDERHRICLTCLGRFVAAGIEDCPICRRQKWIK